MRNYNLEKRKFVIAGVAVAIVFGYILRLFTLQIMSDDYKKNADSNAFLNKVQYPARGAIYDRKGRLMVYNQPAYDVTVIMREVEDLDTLDFCRTLDITPEFFRKRMEDIKNRSVNPGYSPYTEQVFLSQLPAEEFAVFQEKLFRFPGFYIQRRTTRQEATFFGATPRALAAADSISSLESSFPMGFDISISFICRSGLFCSRRNYSSAARDAGATERGVRSPCR